MKTVLVALALMVVACGSKKTRPAPAKPITGAPVAVVAERVHEDSVDVSVYNFADRPVVAYWFLIRYKDADGKVLNERPDTMSMSGNHYRTDPRSWSSFTIDMLDVPEGAKTAEVIVKNVSAASRDGTMVEDAPLWSMEGMEWPEGR